MSVRAVLLFGSQARSDQRAESDTDLLLVTEDRETQHMSHGRLSMFFYSWAKLVADAQDGDLFVCHIVREAKPLFDPEDLLVTLRQAFVFRSSYAPVIAQATEFGWYLAHYGATLNRRLLAKRIVWCVRTILVARSAELRSPVFAPKRLADLSRSSAAKKILAERHQLRGDAATRRLLAQFLSVEAEPDPFFESAKRKDFIERFERTSNRVALQTLSQQVRSDAEYR